MPHAWVHMHMVRCKPSLSSQTSVSALLLAPIHSHNMQKVREEQVMSHSVFSHVVSPLHEEQLTGAMPHAGSLPIPSAHHSKFPNHKNLLRTSQPCTKLSSVFLTLIGIRRSRTQTPPTAPQHTH